MPAMVLCVKTLIFHGPWMTIEDPTKHIRGLPGESLPNYFVAHIFLFFRPEREISSLSKKNCMLQNHSQCTSSVPALDLFSPFIRFHSELISLALTHRMSNPRDYLLEDRDSIDSCRSLDRHSFTSDAARPYYTTRRFGLVEEYERDYEMSPRTFEVMMDHDHRNSFDNFLSDHVSGMSVDCQDGLDSEDSEQTCCRLDDCLCVWTAFWVANRGIVLMVVAMFFGAIMSVTTRLLELRSYGREGMQPLQVRCSVLPKLDSWAYLAVRYCSRACCLLPSSAPSTFSIRTYRIMFLVQRMFVLRWWFVGSAELWACTDFTVCHTLSQGNH